MVKIRISSLLIGIVLFVFLTGIANAATSRLSFSDVDVKVGGKTSNNLKDGSRIGENAKPGDTVEFRVKVQNNFTSAENLKIRDITVKTTIEGIDDGNDLEEESNNFDLSPGSEKRQTMKFQVPIEVDESSFDVLIHAEGEDKNGTNHESEMRLRLEVDKKSHQLKIIRKSLTPAEVACNRKNVQLATTIINTGTDDEENVNVEVVSPDLGIDFKDRIDKLDATPNEPESRFSKVYSFKVPDNLEAGSYPITLRATYDEDRRKAEETLTLTVNDCITQQQKTAEKTKEESEAVKLVTPSAETISVAASQPVIPPDTTITEESSFKSNAFVVGVIAAEIIAVIVGIVLIVMLYARRD